jgi:hypothetical protein
MDAAEMKEALTRIQSEYIEMPGMKLTLFQAQRLFSFSVDLCNDAMTILLIAGFLFQTRDGSFIRRGGTPLSIESIDLIASSSLTTPLAS